MNARVGSLGESVQVLLAFRARVFRDAVAACLQLDPRIAVAGHLEEVDFSSEPPLSRKADAILLDGLADPEESCRRIERISSRFQETRVIVVGIPFVPRQIISYIESGAAAYTTEEDTLEQLADVIVQAHQGLISCAPEILPLLFERLTRLRRQVAAVGTGDLNRLTPREIDVVHLVLEGTSNKEIASALHIELQTVKNHLHSILEKLRLKDRRELERYARAVS